MSKVKIGDTFYRYDDSSDWIVIEVLTNVVALQARWSQLVIWVTKQDLAEKHQHTGSLAIPAEGETP